MAKVLMISALDIWSLGKKTGAQSFYQTLLGYLHHGCEVTLIIFSNRTVSDEFSHPNLRIIRINNPFRKWITRTRIIHKLPLLYFIVAAFIRGMKHSRNHKPDLLYGYEVQGLLAASMVRVFYRKPLVSRFQGTVLYPVLNKPLHLLRRYDHVLAMRIKSDFTVMANDGTMGDRVLEKLRGTTRDTGFWFNGVPEMRRASQSEAEELRTKLNLDAQDQVLLTVSRLTAWKRVDRIIDAMPKIIEESPRTRLVIVGDGDMKAIWKAHAESLGVAPYVIFAGAVAHEDLPPYYRIADVFVSLYDLSNMGNPLFEAMRQAKCIVTLDTGATGTIINNEKNGILLSLASLTRLARVIIDLLSSTAERDRLGREASAFANENFLTWEERMDMEIVEVKKRASINGRHMFRQAT